jgi:tRNA-binding protein
MVVDFGKFGKRVSYGRFTQHPIDEVKNRLVLGVLNFEPRQMGPVTSEVLIFGVQYPIPKNRKRGGDLCIACSQYQYWRQ